MECDRNDSDLEEDSELEALRLAALATLKSRSTDNLEPVHSEKNVSPPKVPSTLSTAIYNRKEQVSGSKGQYSWKNSANQQRRGRGRGGVFPKAIPRSNLIVITPVSTDEKEPKERPPKPQLSLPQHRWCQSVNEDSSSPKTYSKRGPTRFNRHESSSESSDSDYDESENDSYSNETILQDENSANFSQQTPEESIGSENSPRTRINSERRLSFQNTSLDNLQGEEDKKNSRTTYRQTSNDDKVVAAPNDTGVAKERDSTNFFTNKHSSHQSEIPPVNGEDCSKIGRRQSYVAEDSIPGNGAATVKKETYTDDPKLTQNDLRLELKKRMLKLRSENADLSKSEKLSSDKQIRNEEPRSDGDQRRCVRDSEGTRDRSRSLRTRSPERNRDRLRSSSPRNSNFKRSQSRDRHSERESSCSPVRRRNRESSDSPDRNGKRSWTRSPVKRNRQDSLSPDQSGRRDCSRSPSRTRTLAIVAKATARNRNSSHSPNKNHKRSATSSPNQTLQRGKSRSPYKTSKDSVLRNLDSKKDDARIPFKNSKASSPNSPQRKPKDDKIKSPRESRTSSVTRIPKLNHSRSPDKNSRRSSPRSPERKPRQKISWSPVRSQKRNSSRSPERRCDRSKRDRCRSPVKIQKRDSPTNLEKNSVIRKDKYSRYNRSSRSSRSSTLSSRSSSRSSSSSPCVRSISSVIKPVQPQPQVQVSDVVAKRHSSPDSDFASSNKRGKHFDEKPKAILSLVKSSIVVGENLTNVSNSGKRLPVHMRLGTLPRNKLIRMTKDVEAAFVNSSSDDEAGIGDGKKQNFRVVAEVSKSEISKRHVEKSPSKNSLDSKSRRKKTHR